VARTTGRGAPEDVAADQRRRILAAAIAEIEEQGYRAMTVADLIARAGVSRKTFYECFANKEECLLGAFDAVVRQGMRRVQSAYDQTDGWPDRVDAAIRALFEAAIESPGALRVGVAEVGAAGAAGIERRERALGRYEEVISDALRLAPGEGEVPEAVLRGVVGGFNRVLYRGLLAGRDAELLALVPDLVRWATSYYPTPASVLAASATAAGPTGAQATPLGGRAPGTLAPHARVRSRRGLPRGDQNVSRSYVVHNQRERIMDAVANLTAANGYAGLSVDGIVREAAVSWHTFYEHFADKEDAFLVTYEVGHNKGLALAEAAYAAEPDWRSGLRAALRSVLEFLAGEPAFAHLALVDVLIATPAAAERSSLGVSGFSQLLVPGLEEAPRGPRPPAVTVDAVAGGIFELCLRHTLHGRTHELPALAPVVTYFALAPFIGAEQAASLATSPDQA
jgi:AcrR family transcriptional regulator